MSNPDFASWMQHEMSMRRLSQHGLARIIDLSPGTINHWFHGRRVPDPDSCRKLAHALSVDPDTVLAAAGHRPPEVPNRVQHWIDTMRRDGLSASTIHSAVHVLSASLRSAVDLGIIQDNPCERTRRPTARRKPVKVWTLADVQRVLSHLNTSITQSMFHTLYRLALTTGMRPGELRALQWRDIDFERSIVTIRRSMSKDSSGRTIVGTSTKTGRERMVVLTEATLSSLSRWKSEQSVTQLPGYVFTRPDGKWMALTSWQRDHRDLCQAAGVPEISLHALRHTAATLLLELGQPAKIVSEILGHSTIATTMDTYSHVSETMQRQAVQSIEDSLLPASPSEPDKRLAGR